MSIALNTSLIEMWEIVLAVLLLLGVSVGIIYVHDPNLIYSKTLNNELSYVASIKGDKDYEIKFDLNINKEIELENNKNKNLITLKVNNKETKKEYIGNDIEIKKENNQIIIS